MSSTEPAAPTGTATGTATERAAAAAATEDERRGLGPLGWIVVGGLAAVIAVGWSVVYVHAGTSEPGITGQTVSWNVRGATSVDVTYAVAKPRDTEVRCVVDAFDPDFVILAKREVVVPAGRDRLDGSLTLTTPRRATGARIHECAPTG